MNQKYRRPLVVVGIVIFPFRGREGYYRLACRICYITCHAKQCVRSEIGGEKVYQTIIPIRSLYKYLGLTETGATVLEILDGTVTFLFFDRQIAIESEALTIESGCHKRHQNA